MSLIPTAIHPAQQDVFIEQLLNQDSPFYNVGGYVVINGALDSNLISSVFGSVVQTFDTFKIRYDVIDGEPVAFQDTDYDEIEVFFKDFSGEKNSAQAALKWMREQFAIPFKLKKM